MAGSRRTPIDRSPRPILDAEAVRMFRRGTRLMDEGREGEKEFKKLALMLHRKLGLKPWHQSVFEVDDIAPVDPHQFYDWKWVTGLRDQLAALAYPRPRLVERRDEAADAGHAEPPL